MANEEQMLWKNKCHPYFKEKLKSSHHNCLPVLALHLVLIKWAFLKYFLAFKIKVFSYGWQCGNDCLALG